MLLLKRMVPFIFVLIVTALALCLPWWAMTILSLSALYRPLERLRVFLSTTMAGLALAYIVREVQNSGAGSRVWSQLFQLDQALGLDRGVAFATTIASLAVMLIAMTVFTLMIGLGAYVILRLKEIKTLYRQ